MKWPKKETIAWLAFGGMVLGLIAIGLWKSYGPQPLLIVHEKSNTKQLPDGRSIRTGSGVMGTDYTFQVTVPWGQNTNAEQTLDTALGAARRVEAQMSTWNAHSEVSRLNAAPAGHVTLDTSLVALLETSAGFYEKTDGVFDITVQPIIALYRRALKENRVPTDAELIAAREASKWEYFKIVPDGVDKALPTASVNLGGIAKGYAIDQAIESMKSAGVRGGLAEIGGDLRVFGARPVNAPWVIGVRSPFHKTQPDKPLLMKLALRKGAVCTSGNYERGYHIDGKVYSHIIDPRPEMLTRRRLAEDFKPHSVTVIAPDATTADAWATAVTILDWPRAKALLAQPENKGVEAMIVLGTPTKPITLMTPGFRQYILEEDSKAQANAKASMVAVVGR